MLVEAGGVEYEFDGRGESAALLSSEREGESNGGTAGLPNKHEKAERRAEVLKSSEYKRG